MRAVSANFLALLLLCTCSCVFYVWNRLESRYLERHGRGLLPVTATGSFHRDPSGTDLSAKTFRALLTIPPAQRLGFGGRLDVHNLSGPTDQSASPGQGDYLAGVENQGSARRQEGPGSARRQEGPGFARRQEGQREGLAPASAIEDGVFWSGWLEEQVPAGFSEPHAQAWRERARASRIVKLEPGCGRVSNQLATFADGSRACVRYGINADQVQGETLTYYLAELLGITNLPPLALARVSGDAEQWAAVRRRAAALGWAEGAVVSLTEWVANLTGVVTPAPLRQESGGLHPPLLLRGANRTAPAELLALVQWSDLVLFDYLTGNFDRLVSNLFSRQWDPRVMERDTNNLLRTPRGHLVFLDNEAGLVHGYRVLDMWERYHAGVLASVCVFRRRTARRVAELSRRGDTRTRLLELYREREPLAAELGFLSDEHAGVLQARVDRVYRHILSCQGSYGSL